MKGSGLEKPGRTARLVVHSGPMDAKTYSLPAEQTVHVGRAPGCLVRLRDSRVSKSHCSLEPTSAGYFVTDNGSSNGTFVNGRRVKRLLLRTGDVIVVGDTKLEFSAVEVDELAGQTIGGYRIAELLGRGGMGTVYKAVQVALNRTVALKVLSDTLSEDRVFIARFVDEARAAAKLSHPNVVQIHNVGKHGDLYYISMEYVDGGSLQDLIRREGALSSRRILPAIIDASRALVWGEQNGIVHRDIKPANLLLDANGRIKVADFGIAADIRECRSAGRRKTVAGSPQYMAPEQATGKPIDHRADIYALGATLYHALAGQPPWPGLKGHEILIRKVTESPAPLAEVYPAVPAELSAIVARMMARSPEERFQNARSVLRRLLAVQSTLAGGGKPRSRSPAAPVEAPAVTARVPTRARRTRRRRSLPAGPLLVVAAAAAGIIWLVFGDREKFSSTPSDPPFTVAPPSGNGTAPDRRRSSHDSGPREPAPAPVVLRDDPRDAFRDVVENDLELLVLEGRFDEAGRRLRSFRDGHPTATPEVDAKIAELEASKTLFEARRRALELEEEGEFTAAAGLLKDLAERLPEPLRIEALESVAAIEAREKAGHSGADVEPRDPPPADEGAGR